jgi:hypothetical protein
MWPGNNVNANQFAYSTSCGRTRICGGFNGTYVAAHKNGHVAGADVFLSQELHIRSFDHRVCSLNGADETFGFDHTECF